ncbi:hypothetical protein [Magnetococcus marinus]|uniref:hypothetical protein n=1 Tax=Magnetococcus marinus TaxID=1124597 RepID=UPI00003C5AC9|nr:hypothetical protein [Magnetococcus marinus]
MRSLNHFEKNLFLPRWLLFAATALLVGYLALSEEVSNSPTPPLVQTSIQR